MAWTKNINETQTARAENADLRLRFYFGDELAAPPNALRAALDVDVDRPGGVVETHTIDVALANVGALTAQEKTQLQTLLALTALGFTES